MRKPYILAIDQGTTSTRAILFDHSGRACFTAQREVTCLFPHPGWVEVDALSIWVSVIDVVNEVLVKANVKFDSVDSIGVTNQRETAVIWDKKTGMPVYHAIVWQSRLYQLIHTSLRVRLDSFSIISIMDKKEQKKAKSFSARLILGFYIN